MAWTVSHTVGATTVDITPYCSLAGMTLTAGAVAGSRTLSLKIVPGDSGFVPARNADIIFTDESGARRWAGRVQGVERIDAGEVAGLAAAAVYQISVEDIAGIMSQRLIPPAATTSARLARRLPPAGLEAKYDGTFRPLATSKRVPIESALDWALALIETTEAANEAGGKDRVLPAFQVGTATGTNFSNPDFRGIGHEMTDLVISPATGSATYSASSNSGSAGNAADGSDATFWSAGSGAGPYWQVAFSNNQVVSMIRLRTGPTTAWGDMRVELRNSAGGVIRSYKFGAVPVNTTKQYIWEGDIPEVRSIRVRDAASTTTSGKGLARVSAYDTYPIYLTAEAKVGNRKGNMIVADAFSYSEVIRDICDRAQLGWYVDPGDEDGPILRTYSLTQPPLADYEIGDDAAQTPVAGSVVKMARSIELQEDSGSIVNRVVAQYGNAASTKSITVPDDPATRGGLGALARASQTLYGLREKRLGDTNVKTKSAALTAAQRELARALGPEVSGAIRLPYDPAIAPGYLVYIHRAHHSPAIAPKDYYVAAGFIKEVTWTFEDTGTEPFWCDLTIGDPDGARVGFVEGLSGSIARVSRLATARPTVGGVQRAGDDAEAPEPVEWGTYSTYILRPATAAARPVHIPAWSSGRRVDYYDTDNTINTTQATARYLPNVGAAHVDASSRRSTGDGSAPIILGWVPPATAGAIVRARLFLPLTHVASSEGYRVSEVTARTVQTYGGAFTASYYGFGDNLNLYVTPKAGWTAASGGRDDLKAGAFASGGMAEDDDQMFELELSWPTAALSGEGLNDTFWTILGPSRIEYSALPIATGGNANPVGTNRAIAGYWPGVSASRNTYYLSGYNLWDPENPTAAIGFDPRDPDELETGAYLMLMVNTGAVLNAAPGSYVERPIAYGGDKVKQIDLGQPFEPESLTVFINGRKYREDKGDFELITDGTNAYGFDVSKGTNPVRPRGLRNYKPRTGKAVRDVVVVRYRVA